MLRGQYQHYVAPTCCSGCRIQECRRDVAVDAPYAGHAGSVAAIPAAVAVSTTAAVVVIVLVGGYAPAAALDGVLGIAVAAVVTAVAVADAVACETDKEHVALVAARSPSRLSKAERGS